MPVKNRETVTPVTATTETVTLPAKWHNHLEKVWRILSKLNQYLPHDPAVQLQVFIYPKEIKRFLCPQNLQMIVAALVVTAPKWKQPRCPSRGK